MTVFVLIAFLPCVVLAMVLSRHRALGKLRNSALNPMLLVTLFIVIAAADFASIAATGYGEIGQRLVRAEPSTFVLLPVKYAGMVLALLLGMAAVFYQPALWARAPRSPSQKVDMRTLLLLLYAGILAAWFISTSAYTANFFSLEGTAMAKVAASGDPIVYTTSLLLLPALCYALAGQSFKVAIPLILITLALVFFSGSRSRILYALVPMFFYFVVVRGVRIPRVWFLIGVVVLGLLSFAALNMRTLISYGDRITVERVFDFSNLLNSNDLALAESNIVLDRMDTKRTNNYPGENIVSMILAPVPRDLVPFKPESGSVQFTRAFDPQRWRRTGSGLTIGSVNELQHDYPYPLALVVIWLFGAGWAWGLVKAVRSPSIHGFAWTVALYIFVNNFFRGDLFITGGPLFVFAFYSGLVTVYRHLSRGAVPQASAGLPRPTRPALRAWDEQHRVVASPGRDRR